MSKQALLVMDVQPAVVQRYPDPGYLPRLGAAIGAARSAGVPVIYVVVKFRPGAPEVSAHNKIFGRLAGSAQAAGTDELTQVHPDVAPVAGDIVVIKRRVSAFAGSDLEMVLRSGGIDDLVLTGIATSGVVLSTLRQAADLDFGLTVPADGCLDSDPEVHRVLTEKVFGRQAEVTTLADWAGKL
jgi:nicotinamidase-related amidase